jgi:lysophospholipase L1-like esterase
MRALALLAGRRHASRKLTALATAALALGVAAVGIAPAVAQATPAAPGASTVSAAGSAARTPRYDYYLALGDSLAYGIQPDAAGHNHATGRGYADLLAAHLRASNPNLDFVNLSCPGETTTSMINGGCPWQSPPPSYSSQLTAAVSFLRAHQHAKVLVTLDIGANDVDGCASASGLNVQCALQGIQTAGHDTWRITSALRAAAGPQTRFVAMNLYDPFLADWLTGANGQTLARLSVPLAAALNTWLTLDYALHGMRVADVADAFDTYSFTPTVPVDGHQVPLNVARICAWTWMCVPPPTGPNIHANDAGYAVIAQTFESLISNEPGR